MMALRFQACREAAGASAQDVVHAGYHPYLLGLGGVLIHIIDTEIPLAGAADAANFGAGVPGELVGGGPGLAGGFSDHLRLDGVELGEEELRLVFIALGQRHTGFDQLTDALHAFLDPLDIPGAHQRSEEHTSELQSRPHLVCRLLLEKKKTIQSATSFSSFSSLATALA